MYDSIFCSCCYYCCCCCSNNRANKTDDHRLNLDTHACRYCVIWWFMSSFAYNMFICVDGFLLMSSFDTRTTVRERERQRKEKKKKLFIKCLIGCGRRFEFRVLFRCQFSGKTKRLQTPKAASNARNYLQSILTIFWKRCTYIYNVNAPEIIMSCAIILFWHSTNDKNIFASLKHMIKWSFTSGKIFILSSHF